MGQFLVLIPMLNHYPSVPILCASVGLASFPWLITYGGSHKSDRPGHFSHYLAHIGSLDKTKIIGELHAA